MAVRASLTIVLLRFRRDDDNGVSGTVSWASRDTLAKEREMREIKSIFSEVLSGGRGAAMTNSRLSTHTRLLHCRMPVSIRDPFNGPERLSPAWTLRKGHKTATCEVWSHLLGFELRLTVTGDPLPRTHVCKSQDELITTDAEWRAALEATGWTKK
jgi:hypothetical protein